MSTSVAKVPGEVQPFTGEAYSNLTDLVREILSQTDEEFVPFDWETLKKTIDLPLNLLWSLQADGNLDLFKRYPSHMRRYLTWSGEIKAKYGTVAGYVCQERLHWAPASSQLKEREKTPEELAGLKPRNPVPFADPADYKILRNDWPYATGHDTAHLVVWTKTKFPVLMPKGDLSPEGHKQIAAFVAEQFEKPLLEKYGPKEGSDRVVWFKNWSSLQSVGAVEHFHCIVRGAGEDLLWEWTSEGPPKMM